MRKIDAAWLWSLPYHEMSVRLDVYHAWKLRDGQSGPSDDAVEQLIQDLLGIEDQKIYWDRLSAFFRPYPITQAIVKDNRM